MPPISLLEGWVELVDLCRDGWLTMVQRILSFFRAMLPQALTPKHYKKI